MQRSGEGKADLTRNGLIIFAGKFGVRAKKVDLFFSYKTQLLMGKKPAIFLTVSVNWEVSSSD